MYMAKARWAPMGVNGPRPGPMAKALAPQGPVSCGYIVRIMATLHYVYIYIYIYIQASRYTQDDRNIF